VEVRPEFLLEGRSLIVEDRIDNEDLVRVNTLHLLVHHLLELQAVKEASLLLSLMVDNRDRDRDSTVKVTVVKEGMDSHRSTGNKDKDKDKAKGNTVNSKVNMVSNKDSMVNSLNKDSMVNSLNKDSMVNSLNKDSMVNSLSRDNTVSSSSKDSMVNSNSNHLRVVVTLPMLGS